MKDMQHDSNDLSASLAFDMADFDKRLEQTQQETSRVLGQSATPHKSREIEDALKDTAPAATQAAPPKQSEKVPAESGLLARLALEAKENLASRQTVDQQKLASARRVHDALERILKFLVPFIRHVNNIEHNISRTYRLDARTVFAGLKWQDATVDSRKHGLLDAAHLAYVVFNVNLSAPEPVLIKRPWDQFDALKKELQHLRLHVLDDLDDLYRRPKQEWLQARLDPVLQVQLLFKGDYENNKIEVITRNIKDLGPLSFRLEPENITPELMDDLGLYLIGRTATLPALLHVG